MIHYLSLNYKGERYSMNNKKSNWPINFYRDVFNLREAMKDENIIIPIDIEDTIDFVFKYFLEDIDAKALIAYYRDKKSITDINRTIYGHPENERRNNYLHKALVMCKMALPRRILKDGKFAFTRSRYMGLLKIRVLDLPNEIERTLIRHGIDTMDKLLDSDTKLYNIGLSGIDIDVIKKHLSIYGLQLRTNNEVSVLTLNISRATSLALINRNITTLNDLSKVNREQLNKVYNFSYSTIDTIENALDIHGIKLNDTYNDKSSLFFGFLTNAINSNMLDIRRSKYADVNRECEADKLGIAYIHRGYICLTPQAFRRICIQCNIERRLLLKSLNEDENISHSIETYISIYDEYGNTRKNVKVYRIPAHLLNAVSWCI